MGVTIGVMICANHAAAGHGGRCLPYDGFVADLAGKGLKPEGHGGSYAGHIIEWWVNKTTGEWVAVMVQYWHGLKCGHAADFGQDWKRGATNGGI